MFFVDYTRQQPVVVKKDGKLIGIPCAFVMFPDGVSWCDDGVLQEGYCSNNPYHHLYGPVEVNDVGILCDGYSFESAEDGDQEVAKAWNWCSGQVTDWMSTQENYAYELRKDRNQDKLGS